MGLRSILPALALPIIGCSAPQPLEPAPPAPTAEPDTARVPTDSPPPEPEPETVPELEIIKPGEIVPAFNLTAEDGTVLDSRQLIGKRPFVMVFFASWCKVCERKLPELKEALAAAPEDLLIIGVALDNDETWNAVAPYVERHQIGHFKLVRGQQNRRFATAYNPFGSVPVVEVIDRSGIIAELQRGWKPTHQDKLVTALDHVTRNAM